MEDDVDKVHEGVKVVEDHACHCSRTGNHEPRVGTKRRMAPPASHNCSASTSEGAVTMNLMLDQGRSTLPRANPPHERTWMPPGATKPTGVEGVVDVEDDDEAPGVDCRSDSLSISSLCT